MALVLDSNTLELMDSLYPEFRDLITTLLHQIEDLTGLTPRLTQGFRTLNEQQDLFDQGRVKPGPIVTYARPFETFHNYGLAADLCFRGKDPYLIFNQDKEAIWSRVGALGVKLGLTWGGMFKRPDKPHFEKTYGLFWESCQSMCEDNGISHLWTYLDEKRGVKQGYGWRKLPGLYKE